MKRYLVLTLTLLGFATGANAQPGPADLQAVVGNLQPAVEALTTGLQDTAETLANTQSAVQTSAALGDTVVNTSSTLIQGAPTLGQLGLGAALLNASFQNSLNPALTLIDNPSAANLQNVVDPNDLATIAANLESVPAAAFHGTTFGFGTGFQDVAVELLQGNLVDSALIPGPSATSSALFGITSGGEALFGGTNYGSGGANLAGSFGVASLVLNGALAPQLQPVEDGAAPLFDAATPLTDPVIQQIQDVQL